jgi:hypothetical protein
MPIKPPKFYGFIPDFERRIIQTQCAQDASVEKKNHAGHDHADGQVASYRI